MAPINIFDPLNPRAIIFDHNTRVFFYTDNDYIVNEDGTFYYNGQEILDNTFVGSNYQNPAPQKFFKNGFIIKMQIDRVQINVRLNIFPNNEGLNLFCFFIPTRNFEFEKILLKNNIGIHIVCDASGYGLDPGAIFLQNLNVKYTLGSCYTNSKEVKFKDINEFGISEIPLLEYSFSNVIKKINWGNMGSNSAELRINDNYSL
jgi:hypothetical protein